MTRGGSPLFEHRLTTLGRSTAFAIKAVLWRAQGWKPGMRVRARFAAKGPTWDVRLLSMSGGRSLGVIVPVEALRHHGYVRGDIIRVPVLDWTVLPDEEHGAKKRGKKAAKKARR